MSAGQWMQANVATPSAPEHQVPHVWSAPCDWEPACVPEPEPSVLDLEPSVLARIAREVEVESITATVALLRQHIAFGLDVQAGDEEWAFKVGALGATLRIVDEGLAALVARIEG